MKKLEITKGKWGLYQTGHEKQHGVFVGGTRIALVDHVPHEGFMNNGLLIADAGNTYQECELLPSELLELYSTTAETVKTLSKQNKELREALQKVVENNSFVYLEIAAAYELLESIKP